MEQKYTHLWDQIRARDPEHSAKYAQRWRDFAARGDDLDGEARFVTALVAPGARVLDAGSGQGRLGGYLAQRGYVVAGVDLDDLLVAEARANFADAEWQVGDLATYDLASLNAQAATPTSSDAGFDVIVSAGNVLTFIDPAARGAALANLAGVLAPGGRLVTGFGAGRAYDFDEYARDLDLAGLEVEHRFASWDLRPFTPDSEFLVCVSIAPHAPKE